MKKILLTLLIVSLPVSVSATEWCRWDGSQGYGCVKDDKGYIKTHIGLPVGGGEENYNHHGYYKLIHTEPTIAEGYRKDEKVWTKTATQIELTWTVVEMTQVEKDTRDARGMSPEMYYVLRWLAKEAVIDPSTAPSGIKKAYLARKALEQ